MRKKILKFSIYLPIKLYNQLKLEIMKKPFLVATIFAFAIMNLYSQKQLPNASFEDWENVSVGKDEPEHWSSIKTSDNSTVNNAAPVNWDKSTTAHSGSYSIKLTNVTTIIGAVATGGITNGRFHATFNPSEGYVYSDFSSPKWNTPFTDRPDSVVVWIQYTPSGNDTLSARFILHKDSCSIDVLPQWSSNIIAEAEIKYTGTTTGWVRLSAPFVYTSNNQPEYILAMLTAGAGLNAIAGSVALYDDVELIYNPISIKENEKAKLDIYYAEGQILFRNFSAKYLGADLSIYDISGRKLLSQKIEGPKVQLNTQIIAKGIYIVAVTKGETPLIKKLIVY